MWELLRNGANGKNLVAGPLLFLFQQLLLTNLFASPIWIAGLIWLLRNATARFLGYAYLILIAMMIALHAKHYYPADVYPILMAGGGVAIESWIGAPLVRGAIVTATVAAWLFFAPFSLPVLSEPAMLDYTRFVGSALHIQRVGARDREDAQVGLTRGLGRHARLAGAGRNGSANLLFASGAATRSGCDRCKQLR